MFDCCCDLFWLLRSIVSPSLSLYISLSLFFFFFSRSVYKRHSSLLAHDCSLSLRALGRGFHLVSHTLYPKSCCALVVPTFTFLAVDLSFSLQLASMIASFLNLHLNAQFHNIRNVVEIGHYTNRCPKVFR